MKTREIVLLISIGVLVAWSLWDPANAVVRTFIEDFTTTQLKDTDYTTARWDTVAGELKLPPFAPYLAGSSATAGSAWGIDVSGNYAFLAVTSGGVQVFDISEPSSPAPVGSFAPGNAYYDVDVSGDHAFVGGLADLVVLDVSDPTTPAQVGVYYTGGAIGVHVSGDHAYVAANTYGFQVLDVSDPTNPTLAGSHGTPGNAYGVYVYGDYAFVTDYVSGLQVFDVSDPTHPDSIGTYDTPHQAWGVWVSGNYAYVGDWASGLQALDISVPSVPTLVGSYDTPGFARGVFVSGNRAYVADEGSGLQILDISNPAAPALAGSYDTPGSALDVRVAGEFAFLADGGELQVVNVATPVAPSLSGSYSTLNYAYDVAAWGNYACVAASNVLEVVDFSDPSAPVSVGSFDTAGLAYGVCVSGKHAFVAERTDGLVIIDISDPSAPALRGSYNTPDDCRDIAVSGNHAYVADWQSGLIIIDITDPASPVQVGSYDTPHRAQAVSVAGDHAYVADGATGLLVIDISDPTAPTMVGSYDTPGNGYSVCVAGDYAYVADGITGLMVIDISSPTAPFLAGSCGIAGGALAVDAWGDWAFVTSGALGFEMIDISDPSAPTQFETYDTPGGAYGVAVWGEYVFVADRNAGVHALQVFQSEFFPEYNAGRSLAVDASNDTILFARLTTTQADSISWELSADGGVSWQAFAPNGSWNQVSVPGTDLLWRSTHTLATAGVNPAASRVEISVLYQFPIIVSSGDIPNDQGGYVLLEWDRSGYDAYDLRTVTHYSVWRALHPTSADISLGMEGALCTAADIDEAFDGPAIRAEGGYYWEWLTNVTGQYFDGYAYAAPTYYDSTGGDPALHYFQVIAHTADQWTFWTSYPDSGYSVDNLAPSVPQGLVARYNTGNGNELTWEESADEDFEHFRIYRSTTPDFEPGPGDLVRTTIDVSWNDPEYDGWAVYYKVTAVDFAGNESEAASPETVTGVGDSAIPTSFALGQNVPNPFNPTTTIRYEVPAGGGAVTVRIFDVTGRLVRTLAEGFEEPGVKSVVWNGRDDRGQGVSSGVYFYRMEAPGFSQTRKMLLLR